jgi:hypothetical protein
MPAARFRAEAKTAPRHSSGDAFDEWVRKQASSASTGDPDEAQMMRLLRRGEYDRALVAASRLAYRVPDHPQAAQVKARCGRLARARPTAGATIAPSALVVMKLDWADLVGLDLTPPEAFLLARVDGLSTVQALFDASSMSPEGAQAALGRLIKMGIVELRQ